MKNKIFIFATVNLNEHRSFTNKQAFEFVDINNRLGEGDTFLSHQLKKLII